jgi:thiol-disulfide isomerase/thioredoxin
MMRHVASLLVVACCAFSFGRSQNGESRSPEGPSGEKAQKTFRRANEYASQHMKGPALDEFKKADKQDEGHCLACQEAMIKYGIEMGDWKAAETGASELAGNAKGPRDIALGHYQYGMVLMYEGLDRHKDKLFSYAHEEFTKALASVANFPDAVYADGQALARLRQDGGAKAQFQRYVDMPGAKALNRQRALRYISEPELARARMAPPFAVTTLDGQQISLDDLQGKVVLIDFWATWCEPCRAAVPHIRDIAKKFQGQPLVVLSVNLDREEEKWKGFIAKNEMTWPQYCDKGFDGPIARLFGVTSIPHTFTLDADGVLQDEKIGDASIEGKLKKLVARAQELQLASKSSK